jgi:hypothetical protein
MSDTLRELFVQLGVGVLCFALVACGASLEPSTSTPTQTLTPAPSHTPTPMPTSTPTPNPTDGPGYFPELFHGCWHLETEDVSFEIQLEQQGASVQGTFLLIKMCVVGDELSACRIREGLIEGIVTMDGLKIRLSIPEYDDEGTALLTLADDEETLSWEELDYPVVGLADGDTQHYLPPRFTLIPCDV